MRPPAFQRLFSGGADTPPSRRRVRHVGALAFSHGVEGPSSSMTSYKHVFSYRSTLNIRAYPRTIRHGASNLSYFRTWAHIHLQCERDIAAKLAVRVIRYTAYYLDSYPAIIVMPPMGVTGPIHLNLHTRHEQSLHCTKMCSPNYLSPPRTKATMLPENMLTPAMIAGPANLWAAKRGCMEIARSAMPL